MTVQKGAISMVVTFSSATADTGQVTIMQGRRTTMGTLPAYGHCPV